MTPRVRKAWKASNTLPIIDHARKSRSPARKSDSRRAAAAQNQSLAAINLIVLFRESIFFFESIIMSKASQAVVDSQERLVSAIRSEISYAEELLSATADQVGEKISRLRTRIENGLREARVRLADAEAVLIEKSKAAARAADEYVHESPWTSIGVAAGVGVLIGLALGRR